MLEVPITWQHAIQFGNEAKEHCWEPDKGLRAERSATCTLIPLRSNINILEIRDWVLMTVGQEYTITAIFKDNDTQSGALKIPHLLRFKFHEIESAMLFKLTWC